MEVILNDIKVMYVKSKNGVFGSKQAFSILESRLPTLKQRKFYGVLFGEPETGEYRACVKITEQDNPEAMGLDTWIIPGGKYAKRKIKDWWKNIKEIGLTFEEMSKEYEVDFSRPSIEFYRSQKELIALLPIK